MTTLIPEENSDDAVPKAPSFPHWSRPSENREQELLDEIDRLNAMLESAKRQYDELMDVALQYRQEAIKYYQKFIYDQNR